jgi:hypothetical protein
VSGKKHPKPQDRTPADLLASLAAALNDCEKGGVRIRPKHGVLLSHFGDVLPPEGKTGWTAKVFGVLPESPAEDGSED